MLSLCTWLIEQKGKIHYAQVRPMRTFRIREQELSDKFDSGGSISTDCSETVTLICRLAGLADPNGNNFNGSGFTGTMLAHLPHYSIPNDANIGALCVFSDPSHPAGNHVCMVMRPSRDPIMFSHGTEDGPNQISYSQELQVQRSLHANSFATFLNISKL